MIGAQTWIWIVIVFSIISLSLIAYMWVFVIHGDTISERKVDDADDT